MRRIALLAASSLLSLSVSLPTFAHAHHRAGHPSEVQKHLSTYRDDTDALMTLKIDWQTWKKIFDEAMSEVKDAKMTVTTTVESEAGDETETATASSQDGEDFLAMFNDINQEVKNETGVDLFWDVLLNLGKHLSMGYRAFPNRAGDILFQLDLRSGKKASEVLDKVFAQMQKEGNNTDFVKYAFGPQTLYSIVVDENDPNYKRLSLAVHENTLIATLGPDDHQLKTMTYLGQVHPQDSAFRLPNTAYFKPVEKSLHDHPLWLYTDLNGLTELAGMLGEELELPASEMQILSELIPMVRGLGLGLDYQKNQLIFHGVAAHDQANLTDFQRAYLAALRAPSEKRKTLEKYLLGPSPLVLLGQKLGLSLDQPYPIESEKMASSEIFSMLNEMSYRELLPKFSGLDLDRDILPFIDGNYGFSMVDMPGKEVPQSVLVLGLKKGQGKAFETRLQEHLNIDLKALLSDDEMEPVRLVPHGEYKGVNLFRFSGPLNDIDEAEITNAIFPIAAQKDDVWILGQTEAAVKAALDNTQMRTPELKKWMHKSDTREAANVFFMDIAQLVAWGTRYGLFDEDEELQSIAKAWKTLYTATYPTEDAFEGKMILGVDFGQLPVETLMKEIAGEFSGDFDIDVDVDYEESASEESVAEDAVSEDETIEDDVEEAVEAESEEELESEEASPESDEEE